VRRSSGGQTRLDLRTVALLILLMGLSPATAFGQVYFGLERDARRLQPGQLEFGGSVRPVYDSLLGTRIGSAYAGSAFVGVTTRFDLGVTFGRLQGAAVEGAATNILSVTPGIGLSSRSALLVPVSFSLESSGPSGWHVDPALAVTLPMSDRMDFDLSVRAIVPLCSACQSATVLGVEVGVGFRSGGGAVKVRPVFGVLVHPGDRAVWILGVAAAFRTDKP
jgi:hypothetical protein